MNEKYNKNKKIAIAALSVVAVCLAGGLFYYMGTLDKSDLPIIPAANQSSTDSGVAAPEIRLDDTLPQEDKAIPNESTLVPSGSENQAGTQEKPSDNLPKTPSEATPPIEKPDKTTPQVPVVNPDENGNCQPEPTPTPEPNQPQGGDKQNGQIYVPGFGWIKDEGGGSIVHEADFELTGEKVGEM